MEAFIDLLSKLPVLCLLGLCWVFALLLKEFADEKARRH